MGKEKPMQTDITNLTNKPNGYYNESKLETVFCGSISLSSMSLPRAGLMHFVAFPCFL